MLEGGSKRWVGDLRQAYEEGEEEDNYCASENPSPPIVPTGVAAIAVVVVAVTAGVIVSDGALQRSGRNVLDHVGGGRCSARGMSR